MVGYRGEAAAPEWLPDDEVHSLLGARGDANVPEGQRLAWLQRAIEALPALDDPIAARARERAQALAASHERVRSAVGLSGIRYRVEPHLPADILGCYVIAPVVNS